MSKKFKTEGGQGGNKGHSNMVHWGGTEEIKKRAKRIRRHQDKEAARKAKQGEVN
jgi:hypothetical protein